MRAERIIPLGQKQIEQQSDFQRAMAGEQMGEQTLGDKIIATSRRERRVGSRAEVGIEPSAPRRKKSGATEIVERRLVKLPSSKRGRQRVVLHNVLDVLQMGQGVVAAQAIRGFQQVLCSEQCRQSDDDSRRASQAHLDRHRKNKKPHRTRQNGVGGVVPGVNAQPARPVFIGEPKATMVFGRSEWIKADEKAVFPMYFSGNGERSAVAINVRGETVIGMMRGKSGELGV